MQIVWICSSQKQFDSGQSLFLENVVLVYEVFKLVKFGEAVN